MKKAISIFIVALLILTGLTGCSNDKKSEEELKAEIKAELQAEMAKEQGTSAASKVDMKNMDGLYEFVKKEIVDISRENFDTWEVSYFDITGDGADEAVLVSTYGPDWYEKMEIISGDSGQYTRISSDINLTKNGNVPLFEEGFLTVLSATSGTGEQMSWMDFYVYNGSGMVKVLGDLLAEHRVAFPNADFEEKGEIDGSLRDFTYTVTKHDNQTGKDTIEMKERYTYNQNTMSFDVKSLNSGNQGSSSQPTSSSEGIVYLSELKNGDDVGGLTITDIRYTKGGEKAIFKLKGETVLIGELYYEEMFELYSFKATEYPDYSTVIAIEVPQGEIVRYRPEYIGFHNMDALLENFSASDLNKIKSGSPLGIKIRAKDFEFSMEYYSGSGTRCEFVSLVDRSQGSASQPGNGTLLSIYELNKEYILSNLNQDGAIDTFKVFHSDVYASQRELYLIVNGKRFDFSGIEPDLVNSTKYKIAYQNDSGGHVFVVPFANPPHGPDEVYFFEYSPNYSLELLGYINPNMDIESMDIQFINYSEVIVNNETYALQ